MLDWGKLSGFWGCQFRCRHEIAFEVGGTLFKLDWKLTTKSLLYNCTWPQYTSDPRIYKFLVQHMHTHICARTHARTCTCTHKQQNICGASPSSSNLAKENMPQPTVLIPGLPSSSLNSATVRPSILTSLGWPGFKSWVKHAAYQKLWRYPRRWLICWKRLLTGSWLVALQSMSQNRGGHEVSRGTWPETDLSFFEQACQSHDQIGRSVNGSAQVTHKLLRSWLLLSAKDELWVLYS